MEQASILVCVTTQRACERLIEAGAEAAQSTGASLHVIHVAGSHQHFFNMNNEGEALEFLFGVSKRYNAEMTVIRSEDVAQTLVDFIREHGVNLVIFGQSPEADRPGNIIDRVRNMLQDDTIAIAVQARK